MRAAVKKMFILGVVLSVAGCQGPLTDGFSPEALAANVPAFFADLARQALAAWLL